MASKREWKRRACDALSIILAGDRIHLALSGELDDAGSVDEERMERAVAELRDEMARRSVNADPPPGLPKKP